jgi:hypothetical protein
LDKPDVRGEGEEIPACAGMTPCGAAPCPASSARPLKNREKAERDAKLAGRLGYREPQGWKYVLAGRFSQMREITHVTHAGHYLVAILIINEHSVIAVKCGAPTWLGRPAAFAALRGISAGLAKRLQCTGEHLDARQNGGDCSEGNIVAACRF